MPKLLLLLLICAANFMSCAQNSDMLSVKKKNGRTIKTFYAGSQILFQTDNYDYVQGWIKAIKNDSVFVTVYDIGTVPTRMGVTIVDTFNVYTVAVNYKNIRRIKVFDYDRFLRGKVDKLLMFGGAGDFLLNLINSAYLHESVTDDKNLRSLSIAAGAFVAGLIIHKFFPVDRFSRRRHKIVYISTTVSGSGAQHNAGTKTP